MKRHYWVWIVTAIVFGCLAYWFFDPYGVNNLNDKSRIASSNDSNLPQQTNRGNQKLLTKNGVVTFAIGEQVDYENWGSATSTLALVFVAKGGQSGTFFGGCGVGSSFIEVTEPEDDYTRAHEEDFADAIHTEKIGNNTYEVYNWTIDPSIRYYVLKYTHSGVVIVYRPKETCANGKNYSTDLDTLLSTFKYERYAQ